MKDNEKIARVDDLKSAQEFVKNCKKGDVILFMGAGVIDKLARAFFESQ